MHLDLDLDLTKRQKPEGYRSSCLMGLKGLRQALHRVQGWHEQRAKRSVFVHGGGHFWGARWTVPGLAKWVVQKENYPLEMGLANFFCEGPESKHLRLCEPHSVCSNFSAAEVGKGP